MSDKKMTILGIGPYLVAVLLVFTVLAIYLIFNYGLIIDNIFILWISRLFGLFLIVLGFYLWYKAVLSDRIVNSIYENKLLTTGIYSKVRNPLYSGFYFVFVGIVFCFNCLIALLLAIIFYYIMTIAVKKEEKVLEDIFGDEYIDYKSKVNSILPSIFN